MRLRLSANMAMVSLVISLTAAAHVDTNVAAFGINCEGSIKCGGQPGDTASLLVGDIDGINVERYYTNGEHIACRINICAFLQNQEEQMSGAAIRSAAHDITEHGCKVCGSAPTKPGNNVADGQLTFNFVSEAACREGLC
ncbi:killer toxin [Mycena alexandri]|uniref:Killer toxin n=1 Tax=Mycena alexandri TaxID=1745969 RepID=A0AAD6TG37_9AGAR|nr:killer toxin [Mycena alexandri]